MPTTTIQHKRDTAAIWTASGRILANGQLGYETDTGRVKIGNGSSVWSSLPYIATPLSAFVLTLLDDTSESAARATLGVDPPHVYHTSNDTNQTFDTNTTLADLSGIELTLPTDDVYEITGTVRYEASNVAVGLKLGVSVPDGADTILIRADLCGDGTSGGAVTGLIDSNGDFVAESATPAGGVSVAFVRGIFNTGGTNRRIRLQAARNTDTGDHEITTRHVVLRARLIPA